MKRCLLFIIAALLCATGLAQSDQNLPSYCESLEELLVEFAANESFAFTEGELDSISETCNPQPEPEIDTDSFLEDFREGWEQAGREAAARREAERQTLAEAEAQARRESDDPYDVAYQACLDEEGEDYTAGCAGRASHVVWRQNNPIKGFLWGTFLVMMGHFWNWGYLLVVAYCVLWVAGRIYLLFTEGD